MERALMYPHPPHVQCLDEKYNYYLAGGTVVHLVNRQELPCPAWVWLCTHASVGGSILSQASYT
jgi:hypothetical protein